MRQTRTSLRALIFVLLISTSAFATSVVKIRVDDTIQPISAEYVERAIEHARQTNADAVLIELHTPGGLVDSTREIIEKILASPVPVIVYVAPTGANAASAGFFILESSDIAAMAPGTNTGAAHPVTLGGEKMDDVMKTKVENDSAAFMRSFVGPRGRNVQLAESAVRESKSWTDQEALQQHLIDIVAKDQDDLFRQISGRTIKRFDGKQVKLDLVGAKVDDLPMTLRQRILDFLLDPNIAFLVLAVGALALYAEFNHPGAVVPGVVGVIFILLALFALNLLPTRYAAFTLILAAFVLFILEAKFATHGILGLGGIACLTLGGLLLVDGPIPELRVKLWTALGVSIPLGVITVFLMTIALRARRNKVVTGEQGLIGAVGEARTDLDPEGKVFVLGELWNARAASRVGMGDHVVVRKVEGLELEVEKT
ncbi:MAG TPA: nodulation protein NfeD [Verrucomicrobiae bacterium]|jgi:membrane-bound serine protease (ClpP class)|nr:nodulation protein NfeD [Verrucomicrobiae bacterium]